MTKDRISFIVVVSTSLLCSILHCPFFEILFDDKDIFRYTGLVIAKGGVPYRDFFDHKPPLIFFLNFIGLAVEGWGLWIIDTVLVLFTSITFLKLCNKYKLKFAWFLPMLFNLLIRDQFVSFGIGMTREYTAILILLFFCALLSDQRQKYYVMGCLSALVLFMQQDQVLILAPFVLYSIFDRWKYKNWLNQMFAFVFAFLVVTGIVIGYFAYHNTLQYFWEDAFAFNFNWYNKSYPSYELIKSIRNTLNLLSYEIPFYTACILGFVSLFSNKYKYLLAAALSSLFLSFCSIFISGKLLESTQVTYYFLPLAATIPIVLFLVFSGDRPFATKKILLTFALIIALQPILGMVQYSMHLPSERWNLKNNSKTLRYLEAKGLNDYDLYIAFKSHDVAIYNELKILSPSPWIYHFFWNWTPGWDVDNSKIQSITSDLKRHKTTFILDHSGTFQFNNSNNLEYWRTFLKTFYEIDSSFQNEQLPGTLWHLKTGENHSP